MSAPRLPRFRTPQLATLVAQVPAGDGWIYEMKYDGYRCLAAIAGSRVRLYTRSGQDWTQRFSRLVEPLAALTAGSALLDGEVCALDAAGRTDFSSLGGALSDGGALVYFAFDLLEQDGVDVTALPLVERKARLSALLAAGGKHDAVQFAEHIDGRGTQVLDAICRAGHEGVIAKRGNASYRGVRSDNWLKVKCTRRGEFVIVGWRASARRRAFASLVLAERSDEGLRYRGRVGTGFSHESAAELQRALDARTTRPFAVEGIPATVARGVHWVKPELVAEVAFTELTNDGVLRHPSFKSLRTEQKGTLVPVDRTELSIRGMLAAELLGVRLTHPERIVFTEQGVTKGDLAGYYDAVAERMLPHIVDRPLSLLRCPQGGASSCFFQKHDSGGFPEAMDSVRVAEKDGDEQPYFVVHDVAGVIAGTQMNVLEWHAWGAPIADVERPDRLVFDLDPDTGLAFGDVREAATEVRELLRELGLESVPMVSGGKGIHVIVPLAGDVEWPAAKDFAHRVALRLAERDPKRYVATMSKAARVGRIFVDYLRNERGATAIVPWSTRAREGAPVAVPVSWRALEDIRAANAFGIDGAIEQAAGKDPWPDFFTRRQRLRPAISQLGAE